MAWFFHRIFPGKGTSFSPGVVRSVPRGDGAPPTTSADGLPIIVLKDETPILRELVGADVEYDWHTIPTVSGARIDLMFKKPRRKKFVFVLSKADPDHEGWIRLLRKNNGTFAIVDTANANVLVNPHVTISTLLFDTFAGRL